MKKGDIKKGANGETYILLKKIGRGGQAAVWKAQSEESKTFYAYKEYKQNTNNIRANIEDLIKIGKLKDKNGNNLDSVVLPITTVESDGDTFGYIMELVDLQDYTTIKKAWLTNYPSCKAICNIVKNLSQVFETLHLSYGMCYKDVNEGNIFFNPNTGDIKIIDNDNIGYRDKFTIKGTSGYMAPEVVLGDKPDHNSDRFSFAVFVYRLLIGGFPFEGPYTENYCIQNNVLPDDARKVIFGTHALFVWHPTNRQNSIEHSNTPQHQGQVKYWRRLPSSVKDLFINTFAINLSKDRRAERATDSDWRNVFDELEKNLVTCPSCGKITFSESGRCFECNHVLTNLASGSKSKTKTPRHRVTFKVLSAGEDKKELKAYVADEITGEQISKHLPKGILFKVLYNKNIHKFGIKNLSTDSWIIVHADKTNEECMPGQVQVLEEEMMIRIIPKTAQLNVIEIQ